MPETDSTMQTYALGHAPKEIRRLLVQGRLLNAFTLRMLENAGITAGMKVLDVGCGPGDVSLLAAELVGRTGSVLGVDSNASVLQVAQARARQAGLKHVAFLYADIHNLALDGQYDAIVGRLILEHLPEHTAILERLLPYLHSGGVVAFQEYDLVGFAESSLPHSPLLEQAASWVLQVFQRVGVELRMGMRLYSEFLKVGLPAPEIRYEAAIGGGPSWVGYEWFAGSVRAVLPLILKFEVATAEEVGIDTLEDRLREEIAGQGGVVRLPALISAWTRKL